MNRYNKIKSRGRIVAIFFIINILTSIFPFKILANDSGPGSVEAAAFEPIDATDMVNLSGGDFTYVLPLMNVPSPEGGYPLALSYHAGIAMDQTSSWSGLGWNINPGAINRSVNGYPDDYALGKLTEYFYDEGSEEKIYSASLSYSPDGVNSVGLNLSWGSNKSLGGSVSLGTGFMVGDALGVGVNASIGTEGPSFGVGVTSSAGFSVGGSISEASGFSGSAGFRTEGGLGLNVNTNGNVGVGYSDGNNFVGLNFSSHGVGLSAGGPLKAGAETSGVGIQFAYNNSAKMNNYTINSSASNYALYVPTPYGFFSVGFGVQKFEYYLSLATEDNVIGPLHFKANYRVNCSRSTTEGGRGENLGSGYFYDLQEAEDYVAQVEATYGEENCRCSIMQTGLAGDFMDTYEVPVMGADLSDESEIELNNPVFPNYDNYYVQAQGLSGTMTSKLYENGVLMGLSGKKSNNGYTVNHKYADETMTDKQRFNGRPYFAFNNEISTYLGVESLNLNAWLYYDYNLDYLDSNAKERRKTSNYIQYYTNRDILNDPSKIIQPIGTGFDRNEKPGDGIGAFAITSTDGKTYHYSLPVYNNEIITRTFGFIPERPNENQAYLQKEQLVPFATHWLLTAVTGPNYVDTNSNKIPDEGDYGYWTNFEYGKWSDSFVWKSPHGKPFIEDSKNGSKVWIRGRKEKYYLDEIKTRTHTALFVKEERVDDKSEEWSYSSVIHLDDLEQDASDYQNRFTIPEQKQLRLKKIILLKNSDAYIDKSSGVSNSGTVNIEYFPDMSTSIRNGWSYNGIQMTGHYDLKENIIDVDDDLSGLITNSEKSIEFNYDQSLMAGKLTDPSFPGKSTLKRVDFKGKSGIQHLPPYKFQYNNDPQYLYDIDDKNSFGYNKHDSSLWSLKEISTPQGSKIKVNYENHLFKSVIGSTFKFTEEQSDYNITKIDETSYKITSVNQLNLQVGDILDFKYSIYCTYEEPGNCGGPCGYEIIDCNYDKPATITQDLGNGEYVIEINSHDCSYPREILYCNQADVEKFSASFNSSSSIFNSGGARTKSITVSDGINDYTTTYSYGDNENGIGYISYLPFAPDLAKELPYSSELPFPKVMYEWVNVRNSANNQNLEKRTRYKFNILKSKSKDSIKFGEFYKIDKTLDSSRTLMGHTVNYSSFSIKDNLAAIGRLDQIDVYNSKNQLIQRTENEYFGPLETPNLIGVTKESYQSFKEIDYDDSAYDLELTNSSSRSKYPNLLKSTTQFNGGFEYVTTFKDFDQISGTPKEIWTSSSNGDQLRTMKILAYEKYPQMGSKVILDSDPTFLGGNMNMLSQEAGNISQIFKNGEWKNINVAFTTWKPQDYSVSEMIGNYPNQIELVTPYKVWRKHQEYIWNGEFDNEIGSYLDFVGDEHNFDWSIAEGTTQVQEWKKILEISKYNNFSQPQEMIGPGGNFSSIKMNYQDEEILIQGNAKYNEIFFSGAEDILSQGDVWSQTAYVDRVTSKAHTGSYSVQTPANYTGFSATPQTNKIYKVSIWTDKQNYSNVRVKNNGQLFAPIDNEIVFAGDWVQLNFIVDLTDSSSNKVDVTTISGTSYLDDFRIYPIQSNVNSYVYNDWGELEAILDGNNLATSYEYNASGKLKKVYKERLDTPEFTGGMKLNRTFNMEYKAINEIDSNDNGTIDTGEGYPGLSLQFSTNYDTEPLVEVTAISEGGSGQYEYRWAQGSDSSNLSYGSWTTNDLILVRGTCPDGGVYYKCQVKDLITGELLESFGGYLPNCEGGGPYLIPIE